MGAAFITRRGVGGSTRLEPVKISTSGNNNIEWKNLAMSTNTYFLQAESVYTGDWTSESYLEAFIENGEIEVLRGSPSQFSIQIGATSIRITTPYSNTTIDGSHTNLYRFC
jgi:hypothetical protein